MDVSDMPGRVSPTAQLKQAMSGQSFRFQNELLDWSGKPTFASEEVSVAMKLLLLGVVLGSLAGRNPSSSGLSVLMASC